MKIKEGYRLRKVGNNNIVVAVGGIDFTGLITINETGSFIWKMLENGADTQEIVAALAKECNVKEEEIKSEVEDFISELKGADLVE
ncbi:MAG: PqqD family protein [Ruminococcus sp.]|nr:PqqD family protein [Candidatus Copronaster equi]